MTAVTALLMLLTGAGLLAVWIDVRFRRLQPTTLLGIGGNVLAATLLNGSLLAPMLRWLVGLGFPHAPEVGVLALALPSLTYAELAVLWVLKLALRRLPGLPG